MAAYETGKAPSRAGMLRKLEHGRAHVEDGGRLACAR